MSTTKITTSMIVDGAVITDKIADANVTSAKLAGQSVIPSKLANSGYELGMRNAIINGSMQIAERGASISLTSSGQYSLDRWMHTWDGAGATRAAYQQTFPAGTGPENINNFLSYAQSVAGTGGTFNVLEHRIEGVDTFAAQVVSLSFYARNNAGTALPQIICRQFFGSTGSAIVNTTVAMNVATTSSFTRYTYTFTVPSISGKTISGGNDYLSILILLPLNSIFTFDITGVQLEGGTFATPFDHRPYGEELSLCQRYFERIDCPNGQVIAMMQATSTSAAFGGFLWFKNKKRATPVVSISGTFVPWDASGVSAGGTLAAYGVWKDGFNLTVTGASGLVAGNAVSVVSSGGDAAFLADSEL